MGGLFGGFVNPLLALGALAAALPLIIHLLNRQRHKRVAWAAMRFVEAAYKKTRRRVEMENLLLLLLRMAAVALLAFALARPFTGKDSPLAALGEARRDRVVILDASASMGAREAGASVFDTARERALALARELKGASGDRLRVILAGAQPRLLAWGSPEQGISALESVEEPLHEPLNLAAAMGEVHKLAKEAQTGGALANLEVFLLTDAQKRNFVSETPEGSRSLFETLDALSALDVRITVEDFGPADGQSENLAVLSVQPLGEIESAGGTLEVAVRVANFGARPRGAVRVSLAVDGERRPSQSIDIGPRETATAMFRVGIDAAGEHLLEAGIEADRLALDNQRAEVVSVPDALRVLIADGRLAPEPENSAAGYLELVLEPPLEDARLGGASRAPFRPRRIAAGELAGEELSRKDWDALWLADVARLSEDSAQKIERFAASGGLVVISAGEELDLEHYNRRFFRADGSGLLPAELLRVQRRDPRAQGHWRIAWFETEHPALRFFADERFRLLLTEAPISGFIAARALERSSVLAALDDANASPLLIERTYDRGRVVLLTSSIDDSWTRIPRSPATLIPLTHELLRYGARASPPRRNLGVGEALEIEVSGVFPRNLRLSKPGGAERALLGEPQSLEGGRWKLPAIGAEDTDRVGAYSVLREGAPPAWFAVQFDAREGDLERLSKAELAALHRVLRLPEQAAERAQTDQTPADRGELWRALAIATLCFLVVESLFAAFIGRSRRIHP